MFCDVPFPPVLPPDQPTDNRREGQNSENVPDGLDLGTQRHRKLGPVHARPAIF